MPVPSSATVELGLRTVEVQRGFWGFMIHSAKRGVIFQRTGWVDVLVCDCIRMYAGASYVVCMKLQ
jgi:hypothetical protein